MGFKKLFKKKTDVEVLLALTEAQKKRKQKKKAGTDESKADKALQLTVKNNSLNTTRVFNDLGSLKGAAEKQEAKPEHAKVKGDHKNGSVVTDDESFERNMAICKGVLELIKYFTTTARKSDPETTQISTTATNALSRETIVLGVRIGLCFMTILSYPIVGIFLFM